MATVVDKSPAYARHAPGDPAGDLPTAPTPPTGTQPILVTKSRRFVGLIESRDNGARVYVEVFSIRNIVSIFNEMTAIVGSAKTNGWPFRETSAKQRVRPRLAQGADDDF